MSYEKQTWIDGQSRLSAERMNHIEDGIADAVNLSNEQTITGTKTFSSNIKTNEVDNTSGNAMLRYKSTEDKIVAGSSEKPLTLMGSAARPTYSKDGADFVGNELALKSDVDSHWDTLMANMGIGRWANQGLLRIDWGNKNNFYDELLPKYSNYTRMFSEAYWNFASTNQKDIIFMNDFRTDGSPVKCQGMFYNCQFENIYLSNMNIQLIGTYSAYMFRSKSIKNIYIKEDCNVKFSTRLDHTFSGCTSLVSIGAINLEKVDAYWATFENCVSLKSLHCTHWRTSFGISESTAFEEADLVEILNNLDPVTTTQTLTMGATNMAKLSEAQIKVATDKGWNIA